MEGKEGKGERGKAGERGGEKKGTDGEKEGGEEGEKERERRKEKRGEEGKGRVPPFWNPKYATGYNWSATSEYWLWSRRFCSNGVS